MKLRQAVLVLIGTVSTWLLPQSGLSADQQAELQSPILSQVNPLIFVHTNSWTRMSQIQHLVWQREQLIRGCIAMVDATNDTYSVEERLDAAYLLAQYRASDAVSLLIRQLKLEDQRKPITDGHPTREEANILAAPMTEGLVRIGMPAIPALLDRIVQTDDQDLVGRYVDICRRIEGLEVTQFRLHGLLEKEKDSQNRKRIESALKILSEQSPSEK